MEDIDRHQALLLCCAPFVNSSDFGLNLRIGRRRFQGEIGEMTGESEVSTVGNCFGSRRQFRCTAAQRSNLAGKAGPRRRLQFARPSAEPMSSVA